MTAIPERFKRRVLTHAVSASCSSNYPLILLIQGHPGDGKSFQAYETLRSSNFAVMRFSSTELSGTYESESVSRFKDYYSRAAESAETFPEALPVLLLEDFDLSPAGRRESSFYTVNSQLLSGFLMNLADDVALCRMDTTRRIPLIITGNDMSVVHGPLLRPGRVDVFTWRPTEQERAIMVHSALASAVPSLDFKQAMKLARAFSDLPISAFSAALNFCIGRRAMAAAEAAGFINPVAIREEFNSTSTITVDELVAVLRERDGPDGRPGDYRWRRR
ncbi:AAA family ATPase [Micromonospora sp. NPDC049836]|uniref:AAA family ATPase n=1 Tax=Micromonospora sp. NPDC049836 TaxID=3364274 RepID=UPI0037A9250E